MRAAGLIAAAGTSSRMGTCKALLPFYSEETCFAERIARVMVNTPLDPVIMTVPENVDDATRLERRCTAAGLPLVLTPNDRPGDGLSGSVVTALLNAPDAEALVIAPVDCPFVDVALIRALLTALRIGVAAVPFVDGKRGHPVVFARPAFELLWTCAELGGPRGVLDALGKDVVEVPWSDPRVAEDVDDGDAYERLFGTRLIEITTDESETEEP